MRCYGYDNRLRNIENDIQEQNEKIHLEASNPLFVLQHNKDYVQNQAMRALEDVQKQIDRAMNTEDREKAQQIRALSQRCLTACLHCDYSKATIYGILLEEKAVAATADG